MRRNADRVANRETVPVTTQRFLNIPIDSPLYTPVGRVIERFALTELPQLLHVLRGRMTLVGNRPLPENVIASLREIYPDAEARFLSPAGLSGPVQLVGRSFISDRDRLSLETAYCRFVEESYTMRLDFMILWHTVMIALFPSRRMAVEQVHEVMRQHAERSTGIGLFQRLLRRYTL
jgi:lipopolysaccharide/colanic/teichoic acid biosynthesis glycosyltransferase